MRKRWPPEAPAGTLHDRRRSDRTDAQLFDMVKLAILSDIHSAAGPYAAALEAASSEGFDILVLLGDLLTYGPCPERTLEITREAMERYETILIEGNHDEIYLGGADRGTRPHASGWIGESIDWTLSRIDLDEFAALKWHSEFVIDGLLFAHANPYPFGNWSYLRSEEEFRSAITALASRGLRHGIFGHSHRSGRLEERGVTAMTVGSLGQPRSMTDKSPQWTMVTLEPEAIRAEVRRLDFDWQAHCERIRSTSMSISTKERLCEFFS
jgi:predicted phosphodiesterase